MAVCSHGKGMVFALGDPWGYNEYIDAFDNRVGLTNVFRWLLSRTQVR
jgi:unsaturated rhamnogalacturonyl hydrolase